jgi:hypothetical protein
MFRHHIAFYNQLKNKIVLNDDRSVPELAEKWAKGLE